MLSLFGAGPTRLWADAGMGEFVPIMQHRGTGQGGPESMPLYCMCVGRLDRELQWWALRNARVVRRWHFVDDFVFQALPKDVLPVLHEWARLCARAGVELVK